MHDLVLPINTVRLVQYSNNQTSNHILKKTTDRVLNHLKVNNFGILYDDWLKLFALADNVFVIIKLWNDRQLVFVNLLTESENIWLTSNNV